MLIKQLSVFIQNQRGHLADVTEVLAGNGINIRSITVTEGHEFGILRIITDDPYRAAHLLEEEGYLVKISNVLAIEPADKPGTMAGIFRALSEAGIDVRYIYSIIRPTHGKVPTIILKTSDHEKAAQVMKEIGVPVVEEEEIYTCENDQEDR